MASVAPACLLAKELVIPRGIIVFGELDERITSSERKFRVGYPVNGAGSRPIMLSIITSRRGEPCHEFRGRVNVEALRKELKPGIKRFSGSMAGAEADVVLNVEI